MSHHERLVTAITHYEKSLKNLQLARKQVDRIERELKVHERTLSDLIRSTGRQVLHNGMIYCYNNGLIRSMFDGLFLPQGTPAEKPAAGE